MIALLSVRTATRRLLPSMTEDDYRWLVSGIEYLFAIDAKSPAERGRLVALRRRVLERAQKALAREPGRPPA
jgi:hypothetical protein